MGSITCLPRQVLTVFLMAATDWRPTLSNSEGLKDRNIFIGIVEFHKLWLQYNCSSFVFLCALILWVSIKLLFDVVFMKSHVVMSRLILINHYASTLHNNIVQMLHLFVLCCNNRHSESVAEN